MGWGDGAATREADLICGEGFGNRIRTYECPVPEGQGSSASALSDGDTVADGGGVQLRQRVIAIQVECGLSQRVFGVLDEESVAGKRLCVNPRRNWPVSIWRNR